LSSYSVSPEPMDPACIGGRNMNVIASIEHYIVLRNLTEL
jgi:hypothetical protein